jgi:hypothetical protein
MVRSSVVEAAGVATRVAEDMAKINPLLVTYDDDGKVEGVRYMQLTSVMAKAIQEQQAEIEQLKETVNP